MVNLKYLGTLVYVHPMTMYIDKLDHQDHPVHLDHIDDLDHLDHLDSLGLPQDTYFPFNGFPHFPLAIEHTKKQICKSSVWQETWVVP